MQGRWACRRTLSGRSLKITGQSATTTLWLAALALATLLRPTADAKDAHFLLSSHTPPPPSLGGTGQRQRDFACPSRVFTTKLASSPASVSHYRNSRLEDSATAFLPSPQFTTPLAYLHLEAFLSLRCIPRTGASSGQSLLQARIEIWLSRFNHPPANDVVVGKSVRVSVSVPQSFYVCSFPTRRLLRAVSIMTL